MSIGPINSVSFTGMPDYKKGKQMFEALSSTEQAGKLGAEQFRQSFNRRNIGFKLSEPEGESNLRAYIRRKVSLTEAIKKVLNKS